MREIIPQSLLDQKMGLKVSWRSTLASYLLISEFQTLLNQEARIIMISSSAIYLPLSMPIDAFKESKLFSRFGGYCHAKYAMTLLSLQLATQVASRNISIFNVHPGMVHTEIAREDASISLILSHVVALFTPFMMLTAREGSLTAIWAAIGDDLEGTDGPLFACVICLLILFPTAYDKI